MAAPRGGHRRLPRAVRPRSSGRPDRPRTRHDLAGYRGADWHTAFAAMDKISGIDLRGTARVRPGAGAAGPAGLRLAGYFVGGPGNQTARAVRELNLPCDVLATSDEWRATKPDVAFSDKLVSAEHGPVRPTRNGVGSGLGRESGHSSRTRPGPIPAMTAKRRPGLTGRPLALATLALVVPLVSAGQRRPHVCAIVHMVVEGTRSS